jgi:hypothetical protein
MSAAIASRRIVKKYFGRYGDRMNIPFIHLGKAEPTYAARRMSGA